MKSLAPGQVSLNPPTAVGGETIPKEHDVPPQLASHGLQECQHMILRDGLIGIQLHQQVQPTSSRRDRDRSGGRHTLVAPGTGRNGRSFSHRSPTPLHQRAHQEADFVDENEVCVEPRSFFLIRGQSRAIQSAIASSSRWLDRTRGFCGLNPSVRKKRGM